MTATHPQGRLFNRARLDLLDLRDRARFHAQAAAVDGAVDWLARLLLLCDQVASRLSDAEPSEEGRRSSAAPLMAVEPFPLAALPAPLARYIEEAAATLPAPPDLVGIPVLAVLGAAVGNRRVLELRPHWREGARLFTAVVAPPGAKKSPALERAAAPLYAVQRRYHAAYRDAQEAYEEALAEWRRQPKKGAMRREGYPQKPHEPVLRQLYTTDATLEALAALLEQNPDGLLFLRDE